MTKPRTLIQEMYFDVCDLLAGNTYQELSYDNKTDFLLIMRDKLAELENQLFPEVEA